MTVAKGILPPGRIEIDSMRRVNVTAIDPETGNERTVPGYQYIYKPVDGEPFEIFSEYSAFELTGVVE